MRSERREKRSINSIIFNFFFFFWKEGGSFPELYLSSKSKLKKHQHKQNPTTSNSQKKHCFHFRHPSQHDKTKTKSPKANKKGEKKKGEREGGERKGEG